MNATLDDEPAGPAFARRRDSIPRDPLEQIVRGHLHRVLVDGQRPAAITTGPMHVIERANGYFRQLAAAGELIGQPFAEVVPELAGDGERTLLDAAFDSGTTQTGPVVHQSWAPSADVRPRADYFRYSYQPLADMRGDVYGVLVTGTCCTTEVQLRQELDAARLAAEHADRTTESFLATVSHELRTPLTAIIGYEELLADGITGPVTEEQQRQLGRIKASAHDLLASINGMLTLTRLEVGREPVRQEPVCVTRVVEDVAEIAAPLIAAKQLTFEVDDHSAGVVIESDAGLLRQVLLSFLSNAAKYTRAGRVVLCAGADERAAHFTVRDTGIGIAAEHLDHIFDRFWQVEETVTRTAGGAGIGLTLARRVTEVLGGQIAVESAPGAGSSFRVSLPRIRAARLD